MNTYERIYTLLVEVAPPGWGHTKAKKEKTKPSKPKSKIGGSAYAFDKARKQGRFKGSKESMFKLMWWMHNKGGKPKGKPHYKPAKKGALKKKYRAKKKVREEEGDIRRGGGQRGQAMSKKQRDAMIARLNAHFATQKKKEAAPKQRAFAFK